MGQEYDIVTDTERDARITGYRNKALEIRASAEQMPDGEERASRIKIADGYDAMVAQLKQPKGQIKQP